jgi:flagellar protein FlaI
MNSVSKDRAEGGRSTAVLEAKEGVRAEDKGVSAPAGATPSKVSPAVRLIETYWIEEPYAKVSVASVAEKGWALGYFVEEIKLNGSEQKAYARLVDVLSKELSPPSEASVDATTHVLGEVRRLSKKYGSFLGGLSPQSVSRVEYMVRRDLIGYGSIDPVIRDVNIEDISCDGLNKPIYVWHRKYESLFSNIAMSDPESFDNFIIKLAHLAGRHVSTAFPIVDAMLPNRHRLAATYAREVTVGGSTFTIRKFREEPFSITDLIEMGTLSLSLAAYFWLLLDLRLTLMIMGGTAAGKTSLLNALTSLFRPGLKIVTVEETPELNIPHENWVQFVTRESYGLGASKTGEISLYDLVKTSLRYRPDYIIVGEVRGDEAFVLFQAMATGHGGISTIHAESLDYAMKRLTSPPMNVAPTYIPVLNTACLIERVPLLKATGEIPFGRRVSTVWEVQRDGTANVISNWDPLTDRFESDFSKSSHIARAAARMGRTSSYLVAELERRETVLSRMVEKGIRNHKDVAKVITEYHVKSSEKAVV